VEGIGKTNALCFSGDSKLDKFLILIFLTFSLTVWAYQGDIERPNHCSVSQVIVVVKQDGSLEAEKSNYDWSSDLKKVEAGDCIRGSEVVVEDFLKAKDQSTTNLDDLLSMAGSASLDKVFFNFEIKSEQGHEITVSYMANEFTGVDLSDKQQDEISDFKTVRQYTVNNKAMIEEALDRQSKGSML
tara:strand:- start:3766 stop:4323 length:558 start_codon:yes stop_codon:yes gene_type:complete